MPLNPSYETDIDLVPGVLPPAYGSGTPIPGQLMPAYGYPGGFDFTNPNIAFDSRITFTRASSATYFDAAGTLKTVTTNVPRANYYQDHNPSTLQNLGFLIEEARTNLVLQSNAFGTTWTASGGQTLAQDVTGPDGVANSAWTITWTTTADTRRQNYAMTGDTTITHSIFLKAGSTQYTSLQSFFSGGTNRDAYAIVNWSDFTVAVGGGDAANATATIRACQNGWYRVTLTHVDTATNTSARISLAPTLSNGTTVQTGTVICYGGMGEVGAFASSYIATTTAAATRAADVATVASTNFTNLWNASEGAMLVCFSVPAEAVSKAILTAGDGTANERFLLNTNSSRAGTSFRVVDGGADQCDISSTLAYSAGQALRLCGVYKVNDFVTAVNGGTAGTDTSGTITTVTTLYFGDNGAGTKANVHIQSVTIYKVDLTASQVVGVTV